MYDVVDRISYRNVCDIDTDISFVGNSCSKIKSSAPVTLRL